MARVRVCTSGPRVMRRWALPVVVDLQINANRVGAFFVLAHVFEVELFAGARLLFRRAVGIGNERLAPLHFRQVIEEVDDVLQLLGIHRSYSRSCS